MNDPTLPRLQAQGLDLNASPEAFGFLRQTNSGFTGETLRKRLQEDGYLYLPGVLNRADVTEARRYALEKLAAQSLLDPNAPLMDGLMPENAANPYFKPDLAKGNEALHRVLYADNGPLLQTFGAIFGEPVRHFDYTWFRAVGRGKGTMPHCDVVYMGRGTHELLTAWTPLGDIPLTVGGLMVLENSHRRTDVTGAYLSQDVDTYCENGPNADKVREGKVGWEDWKRWNEPQEKQAWSGEISQNPIELRESLGGRWLTSPEYRMGDVLIFTMRTVHASIDNQTRAIRLSSDSRYQPASLPIDERWVGENPIAHGLSGKRGKIC